MLANYSKGGFLFIDLGDTNINGGGNITVDGIYDRLESNYRKAIYLSGLTINSTEMPAQVVSCTTSGGNYILSFVSNKQEYDFTISDNDQIVLTVTDLTGGSEE